VTPGVEAAMGRSARGVANAVGMAIAQRRLAEEFNRPSHPVIDHWTYAICSDSERQEGIASEAVSPAGHLKLSKLVMRDDDNGIQLDGPTSMSFSEDVLARVSAYGRHSLRVEDRTEGGDAVVVAFQVEDDPARLSVPRATAAEGTFR